MLDPQVEPCIQEHKQNHFLLSYLIITSVQISPKLLIIFPRVHQPSSGGSCGDEDSWCSECAGSEGGAAWVMEGGGVADVSDMTAPFRGVSGKDDSMASFLEEVMEELRGVTEVMVDVKAVVSGNTAVVTAGGPPEVRRTAAGTNALASTLRVDPTAVVGGAKGDGLVDGGRFVLLFAGLKTEDACEAGKVVSVRIVLVMEAEAMEGVLVIGVVVCELGVEPGGVWRTESRKEKVWETGLRLSPVISAKLPLTSPADLFLLAAAGSKVRVGSAVLEEAFSSFVFCTSLPVGGNSSTHMGS